MMSDEARQWLAEALDRIADVKHEMQFRPLRPGQRIGLDELTAIARLVGVAEILEGMLESPTEASHV